MAADSREKEGEWPRLSHTPTARQGCPRAKRFSIAQRNSVSRQEMVRPKRRRSWKNETWPVERKCNSARVRATGGATMLRLSGWFAVALLAFVPLSLHAQTFCPPVVVAQAPTVAYYAPAPTVTYYAPAPTVSYYAP